MTNIDLSIVVLNFNSSSYLLRCLNSIKKSYLPNLTIEVIVVDNNSSDGSQKILKKTKISELKFKYILNPDNYGFSKGNNIGVKGASGKYVLFLNPDNYVKKDTLKTIYKFMENNSTVGVCCPRLDLPDGTLTSASHRGFPTPWNSFTYFSGLQKLFPRSKLFSGYTKGWLLDSNKPHEVDAISGGFFFVRRAAAEQVGWWDEDYFLYGEDIDFCYRLKEKGWKVMFLPKVSVLHYHGISSGIKKHSSNLSLASEKTRLRALKASTEAMKIFYKKHYQKKYPYLLNVGVLFGVDILNFLRKRKGLI